MPSRPHAAVDLISALLETRVSSPVAGRFNQIAAETFVNGSWAYGQIG